MLIEMLAVVIEGSTGVEVSVSVVKVVYFIFLG
jgi:hypothetical protein